MMVDKKILTTYIRLMAFAACILIFITYRYLTMSWFDSFFSALQQEGNQGYRMLMVWVRADQTPAHVVNPIGGDHAHFKAWRRQTEEMLNMAQRKKIHFQLELITDQPTFNDHQELFVKWNQQYSNYFKITLISDFEHDRSISGLFKHCTDGVASICSDFFRSWVIHHDEFKRNVYIDVDRFLSSYAAGRSYPSDRALGLSETTQGVYIPITRCGYNSDLTVDLGNHLEWHLLKILLMEAYEDYAHAFDDLASRKARLEFNSLECYQQDLARRASWWIENPFRNFNQQWLILDVIGPGFWARRLIEGKALPYHQPPPQHLAQTNTWKSDQVLVIDQPLSLEVLECYTDKTTAQHLLEITLMTYDYLYFKKRGSVILEALKQDILYTINLIDHDNTVFEVYPHFLALKNL